MKKYIQFIIIFCSIFLSVSVLVWLDKDTSNWSQIFSWRLLNGILFYGFPAFVVVYYLFKRLKEKVGDFPSIIISLIIGIPITFILMILILSTITPLFK